MYTDVYFYKTYMIIPTRNLSASYKITKTRNKQTPFFNEQHPLPTRPTRILPPPLALAWSGSQVQLGMGYP
jgi:hypothetical protein